MDKNRVRLVLRYVIFIPIFVFLVYWFVDQMIYFNYTYKMEEQKQEKTVMREDKKINKTWKYTNLNWLSCEPQRMEFRNQMAFNLTVNVNVSQSAAVGTKRTPCRWFSRFKNACLTFDQLVQKVKVDHFGLRDAVNYNSYPQDVPMQTVVADILNGHAILEPPTYNDHMLLLNLSNHVCAFSRPQQKYDVVIIVKTAVLSFKARQVFRQMIEQQLPVPSGLHFGLLFSLGLPRRKGSNRFIRSGVPYVLENNQGDKMVEKDGKFKEVLSLINEEIRQFDDIILGNYEDTYFNISLKTVLTYRFASAFCVPFTPVFLFIDDDHGVNLTNLQAHLERHTIKQQRQMFQGVVAVNDPAERNSNQKYFLSKEDMPWYVLPPFFRGFAMLVGTELVPQIAVASAFTKKLNFADDVMLGLIAYKLNIVMESLPMAYCHRSSGPYAVDAIISPINDFVNLDIFLPINSCVICAQWLPLTIACWCVQVVCFID